MRHRSLSLDLIAVTASALAIAGSLWYPSLIESSKYYLLGFVMITVGIPHGAVDHLVSAKIYNLSTSLRDQIKFYLPYLTLMLLMGGIWYVSATLGFFIFILCTVYHFGQADLVHLSLPASTKKILYLSRGFMIMGLLIFFHPHITFPIMDAIAGFSLAADTVEIELSLWIGTALATQYLLLLSSALYFYRHRIETNPWYVWTDSLLIILLFAVTEPITAFAVYFACWHSIGHINELKSFFRTQNRDWSMVEFYKHSWFFSLISFLGLVFLYWIYEAFGSDLQMIAILLILISVLTLPHMLVVEVLFNNKKSLLS